MFKEVQCYYLDQLAYQNRSITDLENDKKPDPESYYKKGQTKVINTNEIREIQLTPVSDKLAFYKIFLNGYSWEDGFLVSEKEGEKLKGILLGGGAQDTNPMEKTLTYLTSAIRDLTNILRCRLH